MKLTRETCRSLIACFLFADAMALKFDIYILRTKGLNERPQALPPFFYPTCFQRSGKRSFVTARQANQSLAPLLDLAQRRDSFTLCLLS